MVVTLREPEEDTDRDPVESWDVAEQPLLQKTGGQATSSMLLSLSTF